MNKLKKIKENVKGFTLVEIIVVLLILAILAAIAVPSMLGYVQEARNSEYIAEGHTGYMAAQTVATKLKASTDAAVNEDAAIETYLEDTKNIKEITKYIGDDTKVTAVTDATVTKGRVTALKVTLTLADNSTKTVVFAGGEASIAK